MLIEYFNINKTKIVQCNAKTHRKCMASALRIPAGGENTWNAYYILYVQRGILYVMNKGCRPTKVKYNIKFLRSLQLRPNIDCIPKYYIIFVYKPLSGDKQSSVYLLFVILAAMFLPPVFTYPFIIDLRHNNIGGIAESIIFYISIRIWFNYIMYFILVYTLYYARVLSARGKGKVIHHTHYT